VDGRYVLLAMQDRRIHLWEPARQLAPVPLLVLSSSAVSMHLVGKGSIRSGRLLLALEFGEIQLWSLADARLLHCFAGHRQTRFILRCRQGGLGLGGAQRAAWVASGSEDAAVCVWSAENGQLLCRLRGHLGIVNAVDWHPTDPGLLASVSDDRTVRVWTCANLNSCSQSPLQIHPEGFLLSEYPGLDGPVLSLPVRRLLTEPDSVSAERLPSSAQHSVEPTELDQFLDSRDDEDEDEDEDEEEDEEEEEGEEEEEEGEEEEEEELEEVEDDGEEEENQSEDAVEDEDDDRHGN
jgi:WD40 repeat protein